MNRQVLGKYEQIVATGVARLEGDLRLIQTEIDEGKPMENYLLASTRKALYLIRATTLLCKNDMSPEAMPVLRTLLELSVNMRWIVQDRTHQRLSDYLADKRKSSFGTAWTEITMYDRMDQIGFGRAYYDLVTKVTYSYSHANAKSLEWKINPSNEPRAFAGDILFSVLAQMLGHVVAALNSYFPQINYHSDIWREIRVTI